MTTEEVHAGHTDSPGTHLSRWPLAVAAMAAAVILHGRLKYLHLRLRGRLPAQARDDAGSQQPARRAGAK